MYRNSVLLLSLLVLLTGCRKTPANRRTEIYGTVIHAGKGYSEKNIRVVAIGYYTEAFAVFSPVHTQVLDSSISDANGHYSMDFDMAMDADSIKVYCDGVPVTAYKPVFAGKINANIDLPISHTLPVIANNLHIINNNHPPLVIFYASNPYDSAIVNRDMDTSFYYVVNSIVLSSFSMNTTVNAYMNCYYYNGLVKKSRSFISLNLLYADTIALNTTVDASIFTP